MSIAPMSSQENQKEECNNKENMEKTFLDDIKLETEDGGGASTEEKQTNLERKVVILNIDKTKTNDEIEDYLYDHYPNLPIEQFRVIRQIPHRVIVTLDTKENADKFVGLPFVQGELIGFKDRITKMSLERFRSDSALRKKVKVATQNGLVVNCTGFKADMDQEKILDYMKNNHEKVSEVEKRENTTLVTFETTEAANRFLSLAYVKCVGAYITRVKRVEKKLPNKQPTKKLSPKKPEPAAANNSRKRKSDVMTNNGPLPAAATSSSSTGSLTLTGFKNPQTHHKSVSDALDRKGIKKFDIQYVKYDTVKKEAVVTLRNEMVANMALQLLMNTNLYINSDKITPRLTSTSSTPTQNSQNNFNKKLNRAKKLKSSENLQKNKIKGWTHY